MIKSKFQTKYKSTQKLVESREEALIKTSMYQPNEIVIIKERKFRVMYSFVRDGVLTYLLQGKKNAYYVPESYLLASDQI